MSKMRTYLCYIYAGLLITLCAGGCSYFSEAAAIKSTFKDANDSFSQGRFSESIRKYEQIAEKYPALADKALFSMGVAFAFPWNEEKDYQKALECFQKLAWDYPESSYRKDSEALIEYIQDINLKEKRIHSQQANIDALQRELNCTENEMAALKEKTMALEQTIAALQNGPADRILIEKKDRRMTLLSKGQVLKKYKIALGGNPEGPKEKQGDKKTPEGIYFIDARNKDSRFHLSLHISYPNAKDKKHARDLGVAPGGDIMIHGLKNGFAWVGELHTTFDWTEGCIAVTDKEIEEIEKLVPNGTIVEIKP